MRAVLEYFDDNAVIDELLTCVSGRQRIISIRACMPMLRKPFIEIKLQGAADVIRHFPRPAFIRQWAEAKTILETLTDIDLISEFELTVPPDAQRTAQEALSTRDQCIEECDAMFQAGLYRQYVDQFGANCRDLPQTTQHRLKEAQEAIALQA